MSTTYQIEMSDGCRWDQRATSSADAIQKALEANAGHKVTKCWIGEWDFGSVKWGGRTVFEIPAHSAVSAPAKRKKAPDPTPPLFGVEECARLNITP